MSEGDTLGTDEILQSLGGARYILILTDDATRYRWSFLLAARSDVGVVIPWFLVHIEATTGRHVGGLHSDGAPKFASNALKQVCQQNGTAERANRVILNRARSLLLDASLPPHLLAEAVLVATQLVNSLPTSTILYRCQSGNPLTRFEAWTGYQPDCR